MSKLNDIKTWQCEVCRKTITGPSSLLHAGIQSHIRAEIRSGKRGKLSNVEIRLMASSIQHPIIKTTEGVKDCLITIGVVKDNISQQHSDSISQER